MSQSGEMNSPLFPAKYPLHSEVWELVERAETIGALVTIASQPGKGTEVIIHWKEKEDL